MFIFKFPNNVDFFHNPLFYRHFNWLKFLDMFSCGKTFYSKNQISLQTNNETQCDIKSILLFIKSLIVFLFILFDISGLFAWRTFW